MGGLAFIIGCARSGTSILGELVAAHPRVRYIWEAHEIWNIAGDGPDGCQRLTAADATPRVRASIGRWFDSQRIAGNLVVEKNPRSVLRVPFLHALFPDAAIVHIVRDGRDVACSLVPGAGGETWYHLKPPSWRQYYTTYRGVLRCAWAWKEILEIALRDLEAVPHLQIRYEDLVRDPWATAREVLSYLGLHEDGAVRAFCAKVQDETNSSYHAQHQTMWYRADHGVRVGRWRENLTEEEQGAVSGLLAPLLARLGYSTEA